MRKLQQAALRRALRTLAQGLGGAAFASAAAAVAAAYFGGGGQALQVALVALAMTVSSALIAAVTSYWQGILRGLPEVDPGEELQPARDSLQSFTIPELEALEDSAD